MIFNENCEQKKTNKLNTFDAKKNNNEQLYILHLKNQQPKHIIILHNSMIIRYLLHQPL